MQYIKLYTYVLYMYIGYRYTITQRQIHFTALTATAHQDRKEYLQWVPGKMIKTARWSLVGIQLTARGFRHLSRIASLII